MKIYISGPVTGIEGYWEKFYEAEYQLRTLGWEVVNPVRTNETLPSSFKHGEYMKVCEAALAPCDAILMLKGWQESVGAKMEFEWANENGICVLYKPQPPSYVEGYMVGKSDANKPSKQLSLFDKLRNK